LDPIGFRFRPASARAVPQPQYKPIPVFPNWTTEKCHASAPAADESAN
jgi:hypothetical protein